MIGVYCFGFCDFYFLSIGLVSSFLYLRGVQCLNQI